jgi:hypothetical protein
MAQHVVLILNQSVPQIQEPQVGDSFLLNRDAEIQGDLTISGTVDGVDVAAAGALAATATQPGDNLSTLVNDIIASQGEAEAGADNTKLMTPLRVAQAITALDGDIQNNYGDASAPVNTNDDTEGYAAGSYWIHTGATPHESYRCVDSTTNLAVWIKTTLSTDELATVAVSGDSDDLTEGATKLLLTVAERAQIDNVAGWRDLEMTVTGAASGGGAPTATVFGPTGNIKQTAFAVNDSVYMAAHVPHDIKPGSTMYVHVHWSTNGTSLNTVKWQISSINAKGHNQENFNADAVVTVEEAAHGTAWRHMITEDAVGIPALEVDSLVLVELKRITNGGAENADTVFGLYVDFHYESQQYATPSRTPDFYTP